MKFSFLVVDDERLSRDYITDLISEFVPGSVINEASSVSSALTVLEACQPDVLFLDIKMPDQDGFSLLYELHARDFELVFITAYSQYAIQALKQGACDYLLKPIKKSEFKETLEKTMARRKTELERRKYYPKETPGQYVNDKLIINHQLGIKTITVQDVVYLKADNTYTTLYSVSGEKIVTSKPIRHFEKILNPEWFFRIHKSYIINLAHLKEYSSHIGKQAIMTNGSKLLISRYRLNEFLQRVKSGSSKTPKAE